MRDKEVSVATKKGLVEEKEYLKEHKIKAKFPDWFFRVEKMIKNE